MMEVRPIYSVLNMYARVKTAQGIAALLKLGACQAWLACWHSHASAVKALHLRAGVFNEPLSDLMKVLASLVDAENRILVPGFLDKVRLTTHLMNPQVNERAAMQGLLEPKDCAAVLPALQNCEEIHHIF